MIELKNLQKSSQNWDKRTKNMVLFMSGSSSSYGGSSSIYHITLHGTNSVHELGSISIKGIATVSYSIAKDGRSKNKQTLNYYRGITNFNDITNKKPDISINIEGSCDGAENAICAILNATKEYYQK